MRSAFVRGRRVNAKLLALTCREDIPGKLYDSLRADGVDTGVNPLSDYLRNMRSLRISYRRQGKQSRPISIFMDSRYQGLTIMIEISFATRGVIVNSSSAFIVFNREKESSQATATSVCRQIQLGLPTSAVFLNHVISCILCSLGGWEP